MFSTLITTKLYIPRPRHKLVSRSVLLARLNEGLTGKLTLISAASGYGKTTLMAEWCATRGQNFPLAWISLDKGDNDLVRFLSYLIAAFQNIQDGLGQDTVTLMQGAQNPMDESILSVLVNELSTISHDFVLVLEDYHVIELPEIHYLLVFLLEHLPPRMHLVILTRSDPPFPLARMRARGELTEIRARDLRFSRDDATIFMNEITGLNLSHKSIKILLERTEGWITGLQLAALSIQGRDSTAEMISTFGGRQDYIVDYLIEEVLERQPEALKMFLLQTSILNRLNGSLCEVLTGQPDGESTLEHLVEANLFVSPLGNDYHWYRYHHLFADVLTNRLQRLFPDRLPELHLKAATWHFQNNLPAEAVEHALAGKDYPMAVDIVESQAMELLKLGNHTILMGWLEKLPPEIIQTRPRLCVYSAWAYFHLGKLDKIEAYLTAAEELLDSLDKPDELIGHIATIRAFTMARLGDPEGAIEHTNTALQLLAKDDLALRCVVIYSLGGIYYMRQDIPRALEAFREASQLGEQAGNIHVVVGALSAIGGTLEQQGNLAGSEKAFYKALQLSKGRSGQPLPLAAHAYSGLARLRLVQKDLEGARDFATTGLELGEKMGSADNRFYCYLTLAQIEHLEGKRDQAQTALEAAKQLAATHDLWPGAENYIAACEAAIQKPPPFTVDQGPLIDPLTERELEILQLLAEGLSNQEIADNLIISLGTVKAHSSNIYRKLDVSNRAQAIVRAQELRLL